MHFSLVTPRTFNSLLRRYFSSTQNAVSCIILIKGPAGQNDVELCFSLAAAVSTFTPLLSLEHMAEQGNNSSTSALDQSEVVNWLRTQLQALLHFMKPDFSFGDHHRLGSHRWAGK
jgi:hypothetical protein